MIRKLMCWLGWHEWEIDVAKDFNGKEIVACIDVMTDDVECKARVHIRCKHCGKILSSKVIKSKIYTGDEVKKMREKFMRC